MKNDRGRLLGVWVFIRAEELGGLFCGPGTEQGLPKLARPVCECYLPKNNVCTILEDSSVSPNAGPGECSSQGLNRTNLLYL